MEKIGIDNIKIAVVAAINLGEKIEKNLADDGKISLTEALGIGAGSFTDVVKVIKSGTKIKEEFQDLYNYERIELVELVEDELDLIDDRIEKIIEKAIEFLVKLDDLVCLIKE